MLFPFAKSCSVSPEAPRYQVVLRYTAPGSDLRNDMQMFFNSFSCPRVDRGGTGMNARGMVIQPVLNLATSQRELRLRSEDPLDQPQLDYHLLDEAFDRERMLHAMRLGAELGRHDGFAEFVSGDTNPGQEVLESDAALD